MYSYNLGIWNAEREWLCILGTLDYTVHNSDVLG